MGKLKKRSYKVHPFVLCIKNSLRMCKMPFSKKETNLNKETVSNTEILLN